MGTSSGEGPCLIHLRAPAPGKGLAPLKNKILENTLEDLTDIIKWYTNRAASKLASREQVYKKAGFCRNEGGARKSLAKEKMVPVLGKVIFP